VPCQWRLRRRLRARGAVVDTLIGALTIVIVQNALNLNAVPASAQNVTIGVIIVIAVGLDMWRSEIGRALSRIARMPGAAGREHRRRRETS
jgi:hypothetical protein